MNMSFISPGHGPIEYHIVLVIGALSLLISLTLLLYVIKHGDLCVHAITLNSVYTVSYQLIGDAPG